MGRARQVFGAGVPASFFFRSSGPRWWGPFPLCLLIVTDQVILRIMRSFLVSYYVTFFSNSALNEAVAN